MKFIFTLLLVSVLNSQSSLAQAEIAVVDVEASVDNWSEALDLENIFDNSHDSLLAIAEFWVSKWHLKVGGFVNSNTCYPPEYLAKRGKELKSEQQSILEYENLITDTIPAYQERIIDTIRATILEKIVSISKTAQYQFVFQKKHILYQETGYPVAQIEIPYTKEDAQYLATTIDKLKQKLASICANYRQKVEKDYP